MISPYIEAFSGTGRVSYGPLLNVNLLQFDVPAQKTPQLSKEISGGNHGYIVLPFAY